MGKQRETTKKQRDRKKGPGGPANLIGQGFHTNPERINKKGRPKLITQFNADLRAEGYEPFSESQLIETYKMLLQLPEERMKELGQDVKNPYYLRRVIHYMGSSKGMEMLDRMLDRGFGRAKQVVESSVQVKMNLEPIPPESQKVMDEFRKKLNEIDEEPGK